MFMNRGPGFWVMFVVFLVAGPIVVALQPQSYDHHRELAIQQFHLPQDADFVAFRSGTRKGGGQYVEGIVQFTPQQYADYVASLNDRDVWSLQPFTYEHIDVTAEPVGPAFKWWPSSEAVVNVDEQWALRWVGWGNIHDTVHDGKPVVHKVRHRRSFCFGVKGKGEAQRVEGCKTFGPDNRPDFHVRGLLDEDDQRLFLYFS